MAIFSREEETLFRPAANPLSPPGKAPDRGAHPRSGSAPRDEETSLAEPLFHALRAAARRPLLVLLVLVFGALTTVAASMIAPREYRATSEILVVRSALAETPPTGYVVGLSDEQKEYLAQIASRPTARAVALTLPPELLAPKEQERLSSKVQRLFSGRGARRMPKELSIHGVVDGPRIEIHAEAATPEAAAAIANAATTQFLATRYATEVKVLEGHDPARLAAAQSVFAAKYQVTREADVPDAPTKPVTLLAALAGLLGTGALVLVFARLADRLAGRLQEPREVLDLLEIPVFGELEPAVVRTAIPA